MAGARGIVSENAIAVVAGASLPTVMQIVAPADQKVEIIELSVNFNGVVNTNMPVLVQVMRQTTAGTMSAASIVKAVDSDTDAFRTTAQHTSTVEPTTTDQLRVWRIHPQTGLIYQKHDQAPLILAAGERVGILVTPADNINADLYVCFEE